MNSIFQFPSAIPINILKLLMLVMTHTSLNGRLKACLEKYFCYANANKYCTKTNSSRLLINYEMKNQRLSESAVVSPVSVGNVMHMPLSVLRPTDTESIAGLEK